MTDVMKSFDASSDFKRYLESKETVDDRALDVTTMVALGEAVAEFKGPTLRVLEVGCGVGNMLPRLLRRGILEGAFDIDYTAIDIQDKLFEAARFRVERWAEELGFKFECGSNEHEFVLNGNGRTLTMRLTVSSLEAWSEQAENTESYDLVIAQAVLDILDTRAAVGQIFALLSEGGLYYFPIHFDGNTIFEPVFDVALDQEIESRYHASMDNRITDGKPSGDSRTGRHLFGIIRDAGGEVHASGGSSWVVHGRGGEYPADEAYFLHFIVDGVYSELSECSEISQPFLWQWAGMRHSQIEEGTLVYIAHQIDFFGSRQRAKS
ncbi:MAG: class I SAM-dependent methyltransferase [Deltaproteobacteria bacterium]|jgi:SAM-dependent methyltransferase|nr:class I SAM-dependent methyltransferase [Deltaproteobacteria bacterium]MBT6434402.1 class I SAM-dependent methyltransferase [Deltaproteobacteria bacterium]MBT6490209.1 class I SAM-dependent methyltransferase [Deltaproteobacteria bacterium]